MDRRIVEMMFSALVLASSSAIADEPLATYKLTPRVEIRQPAATTMKDDAPLLVRAYDSSLNCAVVLRLFGSRNDSGHSAEPYMLTGNIALVENCNGFTKFDPNGVSGYYHTDGGRWVVTPPIIELHMLGKARVNGAVFP